MFAISKLGRLVVGASLMTLPTLATAQTEAPTLNPIQPGRIALVQYTSDVHFGAYGLDEAGLKKSREVNLKNLTQLFNESVKRGAKIVVFPEGSSLGYQSHPADGKMKSISTRFSAPAPRFCRLPTANLA